jgi:hypothetical protein
MGDWDDFKKQALVLFRMYPLKEEEVEDAEGEDDDDEEEEQDDDDTKRKQESPPRIKRKRLRQSTLEYTLDKKVERLASPYTIDGATRYYLLCKLSKLVNDPLDNRGKRFKDSYDFTPIEEDIVIPPGFVMFAVKTTEPYCACCQEKIPKKQPRCKWGIFHLEKPDMKENCLTHVYCLECFAIIYYALKPHAQPVCIATLINTRGGCKQMKLGTSSENEHHHHLEQEEEGAD